MKSWQDDLLTTMQSMQNKEELMKTLESEAKKIGFEYWAYGARFPFPLSNSRIVMLNNYPMEWQQKYSSQNYLKLDPTVERGIKCLAPFLWSDLSSSEQPNFWEEARAYGLHHGWAQSCVDPSGITGMLTLARSGENLTETELRKNNLRMVWLTQVVHMSLSGFLSQCDDAERAIQLSVREIEVLRWTAEAKTSNEISEILGISGRTANFHIANAMKKLNCSNKTAATVKAALLGFLY